MSAVKRIFKHRTGTHFALAGATLTGSLAPQLLATEAGYEVKDWTRQGIGIVKPMYYARHSAWPVTTSPRWRNMMRRSLAR